MNASALPYDLQACCEIVGARSMEARRVVAELTGLEPVHVDKNSVHRDTFLSTGTEVCPRGQECTFTGSPEHGLTLRSDRAWGIDPLGAETAVALRRRKEREKKARWRAKVGEPVPVDMVDVVPVDSCARNSEDQIPIPIPNTAHALPSVGRSPCAREEQEADQLAAGRLRGQKLAVLRRTGLTGCNGGDPRFIALVAGGVTDDELLWAAQKAITQGKGFPYAVAALLGARQDVAAGVVAGTAPKPAWATERDERLRELLGPAAAGWKPPAV
jgi:hypothetical protein